MREIKFDAFIQIKNPEADELEFEHNPFSELLHEGFILFKDGILTTDKEDEIHKTILREFTGLKDKNGKEIYGEDILDVKAGESGVFRFQVVWDEKQCGWRTQYGQKLPQLFGKPNSVVIGNIYENPALLNQTDSKNTG